tara:strand:+ start:245 stop:430 length:186 start_codon:yes stop_codon:yes gene_type:complete
MIENVEVVVVDPSWIIAFILGYVFGFYMFIKTDSIFVAGMSICFWFIAVARIIHYYYGIEV